MIEYGPFSENVLSIYMNKRIFKMLLHNDGLSTIIAYLYVYVCTIIKIGCEHPPVAIVCIFLFANCIVIPSRNCMQL